MASKLKGRKFTEEHRKNLSNANPRIYPENFTFKNCKHSNETKKLMSEKHKERLKIPSNNSQYGTMWITNGKTNKKIKVLDNIPEGWYKGRKIKT